MCDDIQLVPSTLQLRQRFNKTTFAMLYIISSSTSDPVLFTDVDDPVSLSNLVMTTVTVMRGSATESSLPPRTVTSVPPLLNTIKNKLNTNTNSDL